MRKHQQKDKNAGRPGAGRPAEDVEPFDLAGWARALLDRLPGDFSGDERALLDGQIRSLTVQAGVADPLPPDTTAPLIVRDRRALEQIAGIIGAATDVVI